MAINKRLINTGGEAVVVPTSFNTVIYSGTGTAVDTTNTIGGVGFQPDLVWVKSITNGSFWHNLADSVRGVNRRLFSNTTNAEDYDSSGTYNLLSFNNDGFTVGRDNNYNDSGTDNYVAWCWKAGGTAVTNIEGDITSDVSANVDAGFSIVKYTGDGTSGATVGHGLNSAPDMIIIKNIYVVESWATWHSSLPSVNSYMYLDSAQATGISTDVFRGTSSSTITVGTHALVNSNTKSYIAYCFAEKAGFSKFGSYSGNNSATGPTITTGFEPAFVMIKRTDSTGNWVILDNKRDTSNPIDKTLNPNLSEEESTANDIDFNATTFQLKSTNADTNASGTDNYIYMAFANQF